MPGHRCVVGIASRHDPARATHAVHLAKSSYWIIDVLKHLMGVDDVERLVLEVEVIHIPHAEIDIGDIPWAIVCCSFDDHIGAVDADHSAGCNVAGKIHRECAGTTSNIEEGPTGAQVINEVTGRIVDSARPV
jgi:hypothetical protein